MNTVPSPTPAPAPQRSLVLRICIVLSLIHAIYVIGGWYMQWLIPAFPSQHFFGYTAESVWTRLLETWPAWWVVCLVLNRGNWRQIIKPMLMISIIWLFSAAFVLPLLWTFRGGFG